MLDGLDYFYNKVIIKLNPKMNLAFLRHKKNKPFKVFYLVTL